MGRIEGKSKGEKSNRRLRGGKKRVLCGGVEAGEVERLREEKKLREKKMVVRERGDGKGKVGRNSEVEV